MRSCATRPFCREFPASREPASRPHDIADMLANGDSAEAISEGYPQLSEAQIELAVIYARAYPRRSRPRREPFWRARQPSESSETSLDDALSAR